MAKTFDQWMADNQFQTGYGPNYIYNKEGGGAQQQTLCTNAVFYLLHWYPYH